MHKILDNLRGELTENSDDLLRKTSQHFFKEAIQCYGIKTSVVDRISKEHFKTLKKFSKNEIFELCSELWRSGILEESLVACNWSYDVHRNFVPDDLKVFEEWIGSYINNWASCDTFCNHTVGEFIEMYPGHIAQLKQWTTSGNRWMRRASAVSLIVPARKGKFLNDILEIAELLLTDNDDMVQKGYGWMLKVASQKHQTAVFEYVMDRKAIMPRTALRYAIEKMPSELKAKAMEKSLITPK